MSHAGFYSDLSSIDNVNQAVSQAEQYKNEAEAAATAAALSEDNAAASASEAAATAASITGFVDDAVQAATDAAASALSASGSATNAATSETNAAASAASAATSATNAANSATDAADSAAEAQAALANFALPSAPNGASLVGFKRSILNSVVAASSSRTVRSQLEDMPVIIMEFSNIDKTGVTDSSVGIQAAINGYAAIATSGAVLVFPEGTFKMADISLPTVGDWIIRGSGQRRTRLLLANENDAIFLQDDNYAFTHKTFDNLAFHGGSFTNGRGLQVTRMRETRVTNCHFENLAYNILNDRARGFIISDITCRNSGTFFFHSTAEADYTQNIMINNVIDPVGTDIKGLYNLDQWWYFKDVVNANLNNVCCSGFNGTTRAFSIIGKTEGVFLSACVVGWPSVGIYMEGFSYPGLGGTIRPQYCGFINVGMDQPSVSSAVLTGDFHYLTASWCANGNTRSNTGAGILIDGNSRGIHLKDVYVAFHNHDGISIQSGATDIILDGISFLSNNMAASGSFDLRDATAYGQLKVINCSSDMTVSSTNHRILNGNTSQTVNANILASNATTAVTTEETLKSYTIPANALKPGMKCRIRAWGKTAANANTKTVRVRFGSTSVGGFSNTSNNVDWSVDVEVWVKTTTSQNAVRRTVMSNASMGASQQLTENVTTALNASVTGQNGTASAGDITCDGFTVDILP